MKALFLLACLALAGCYQTQNSYLALNPRLYVVYTVFVDYQSDSPGQRDAFAKQLCKGFTHYSIGSENHLGDSNFYRVECSQ